MKLALTGIFLSLILFSNSICADTVHGRDDAPLVSMLENQQWQDAESYLLAELLRCRSGEQAVQAAENLARVSIFLHKAPMAMEWLEWAADHPVLTPQEREQTLRRIRNLHRIYLPSETYIRDTAFHLTSTDLESPSDIEVTSDHRLVIMDRYRLIIMAESNGTFRPQPPTSTLPEDVQSLKIVDDEPVIITAYGYWRNNRINGFQGRGDLNRIIDAVFTVNGYWLVLDRRHADMLRFDRNGQFVQPVPVETVNGDEALLAHVFGGAWMIDPTTHQILSTGTRSSTQIPFKGPGYDLSEPLDMTSDWFGHLYVLCDDDSVTVFSPLGVRLRRIDLTGPDTDLRNPRAIAVSDDGTLYVADRKKHAIYRYR